MHVGVCENDADVYRIPRSPYPAALNSLRSGRTLVFRFLPVLYLIMLASVQEEVAPWSAEGLA